MIDDYSNWVVFVNPKDYNDIFLNKLNSINDDLIIKFVRLLYDDHFKDIIKNLIDEGCKNYAIIGGDGTLNLVINFFLKNFPSKFDYFSFALLPYGTGNDFARYFNINTNIYKSISLLKYGNKKNLDLGVCNYFNVSGIKSTKYFVNSAGFGFEVNVLKLKESLKHIIKNKKLLYRLSLFIALFINRSRKVFINCSYINNQEKNVYTLSIGNGCYSGGGIKQVPEACPDDGLLNVMIMEHLNFKDLFCGLKLLFRQKLREHKKVIYLNFTKFSVNVNDNKPLMVEVDGELFNTYGNVDFQLINNKFNFIVP